ncbi:MAG: response regulator transcription factor [Caldiserica bacterium]|jgi:DNA-binding response OmpR family regulator|nr:response regulator transcription factor [Caldisericota bacterium]MDH7562714.1 response regulator transcription factor [Caldisericota bacterium]
MEKESILVVEDEERISNLIKLYLEREGFSVLLAQEGNEALKVFKEKRPDLVILDLMLPGIDGLEICRLIRQSSTVPILILTAKDEETDKVVGLSIGADDYITKPFSPKELVARVKAHLRRTKYWQAPKEEILGDGRIKIDTGSRQVWLNGKEVKLTALEFDLLKTLASSPSRVFSREQLLDLVWGVNYFGDPRVVDVHIGNIRKKIERDPSAPEIIKTVRDVGYKFESLK